MAGAEGINHKLTKEDLTSIRYVFAILFYNFKQCAKLERGKDQPTKDHSCTIKANIAERGILVDRWYIWKCYTAPN